VRATTGEPKVYAAACQATKSTVSAAADYNRVPWSEQLSWGLKGIALSQGLSWPGG